MEIFILFHSFLGGSAHMWTMMSEVQVFTCIMGRMKVNDVLGIGHPRMNRREIVATFV